VARPHGSRVEEEAMQDIGQGTGGGRTQAMPGAGGPGPQVMAADTLQGDDVYNGADEKLGEITDIMIDVPSGRVAYAVMSVGGVLGLGDRLFAIPWSALRLDTARKCFRLDVSKERVENAPGFDKDHWPSMADPTWAEEVHGYYRAQPYWA
jgi:sporulation protein YlmC with PRC-barrel domain